jgi:astacin
MESDDSYECEYGYSGEHITCYISGETFINEKIECDVIDGDVIFQGDILIGPVDEVNAANDLVESGFPSPRAPWGHVVSNHRMRWPRSIVFYVIDKNLIDTERVSYAMEHWESNTNIRFKERTSEVNYVRFVRSGGCSSSHVGMVGGQQYIKLGDKCNKGNTIHEIGHCIGLFHEHSREDRDKYVKIIMKNIRPEKMKQFIKKIDKGDDVFKYDYGSIMHYDAYAWSIDKGKLKTIEPRDPKAIIGQRIRLSHRDIQTVNRLYPKLYP